MRREISEPKHWRSHSAGSSRRVSWAAKRNAHSMEALPADAVDAAFELESKEIEAVRRSRLDRGNAEKMSSPETTGTENTQRRPDLISSLTSQLTMLKSQHEQLSRLLAQVQGD